MGRPLVVVLATAGIAVAASACYTGPAAQTFKPAVTGHGATGTLYLRRSQVTGELIELRDSAYVMLNTDGLLLVPFGIVRDAKFGGVVAYYGGAPGGSTKEKLRLVSRFPAGMPAPALQAILADVKQSELRLVQR
jgi:hypothetical protein